MNLALPPSLTPTGPEIVWVLASYAIGCFTAGYYWTRWRTGQDIRRLGSGTVGARNVGRALGAGGLAITLLVDLAKGVLAVGVAQGALGIPGFDGFSLRPAAVVASIVAVVAGHIWPAQLRFRGGKGIAVSVGALLAYDPLLVLGVLPFVFLPVWIVLRRLTLSGMIAFALAPLVALLFPVDGREVVALSLVSILVLVAHRQNLRQEWARLQESIPRFGPVPGPAAGDEEEAESTGRNPQHGATTPTPTPTSRPDR